MILESIISIFVGFVLGLLDCITVVPLPTACISVLSDLAAYGCYVVGTNFMLLFASVIFVWTAAKLLVGVGIRIWELLPVV